MEHEGYDSLAHRDLRERIAPCDAAVEVVVAALAEVTDPERLRRLVKNRLRLGPRSETQDVCSDLDRIVTFTDDLGHWLTSEIGAVEDRLLTYEDRAAVLLLRRAVTTCQAISLLLSEGFSLDARARWRGLHELASSSSLLARRPPIEGLAARYLAHARLLRDSDPLVQRIHREEPDFFEREMEWARPLFPGVPGRRPATIRVGDLRKAADLSESDGFGEPHPVWLSHQAVHITSATIANVLWEAGPAPYGYSAVDVSEVAALTARSLYELAANSVAMALPHLPEGRMADEVAVAWLNKLRSLV